MLGNGKRIPEILWARISQRVSRIDYRLGEGGEIIHENKLSANRRQGEKKSDISFPIFLKGLNYVEVYFFYLEDVNDNFFKHQRLISKS